MGVGVRAGGSRRGNVKRTNESEWRGNQDDRVRKRMIYIE